jgi:uncharacterized protein YaaQ
MYNINMNKKEVSNLFLAIVQSQDAEYAEEALCKEGFIINRLPSTGGFLGRRNSTLLIGTAPKDYEKMMEILKENCRQRIEYIAVPLESAPLPLPTPTPVTIGGGTIFSLDIEHFEVI